MCLYQNIHAAYHYELLNVNAAERDNHTCRHEILSSDDGEKCLLHSCCRVLGHEVVFRCSRTDKDGGNLCDNAMKEDVFVPLVSKFKSGDNGKGAAALEVVEEMALENSPMELPAMTMEFWPEDQPGKIVLVYLEEEVLTCEDKKKEAKSNGRWHRMLFRLRWKQ
ncbi:uncharacterized protein F4807DRAFT_467873 [Annulohypoxylon truncatum]|uniref:uncharacterized protein n=1 Tax=Annulohypoxylon truncatum TaxID=327061 RepID=UPI00200818CE|nr:uncharacterized protein F4807DRAFT_467873 [Annulohypoxylon truncatum]KAI1209319.1 hypothetical protein F4807DRAFT_467873 [Annulohypoxylon truncatum]